MIFILALLAVGVAAGAQEADTLATGQMSCFRTVQREV